MSDAEAKLKEMGEKIKSEVEAEKGTEVQAASVANSQLEAIRANPDLAKMYADSSQIGAENLSGSAPLLKVHQPGRSTSNELSDGTEPNGGWFFYKPTGEQFQTVRCHILAISDGFRTKSLDPTKKPPFNQIMSGVIIGEGEMKPFMTYIASKKLQPMWDFRTEVSKYVYAKPMGIPMFALTVKLTTEQITHDKGKSFIINFEIEKNKDGTPVLVTDPAEFQFLRDHVAMVQQTAASIIKTISIGDSPSSESFPDVADVSPDYTDDDFPH